MNEMTGIIDKVIGTVAICKTFFRFPVYRERQILLASRWYLADMTVPDPECDYGPHVFHITL